MNLNRELYEKVLKHKFPGDFIDDFGLREDVVSLQDAFYLAEKLGLFDDGKHILEKDSDLKWRVWNFDEHDVMRLKTEISMEDTPQEAIVRALIAVYGKEE